MKFSSQYKKFKNIFDTYKAVKLSTNHRVNAKGIYLLLYSIA